MSEWPWSLIAGLAAAVALLAGWVRIELLSIRFHARMDAFLDWLDAEDEHGGR